MGFAFNPFTGTLDNTGPSSSPGGADTNVQYNDGGVFGGDANNTWNKTTKLATYSQSALAATTAVSHRLVNTTAAVTGSRIQVSPATQWRANGWRTTGAGSSRTVDFNAYSVPATGTNEVLGEWRLDYSLNGATAARGLQYFTNVVDGTSISLFRANGLTEITANNSSTIDTLQNLDIVNTSGNRTHLTMTFGSTIRWGVTNDGTGNTTYQTAGSSPLHNFHVGSSITSQSLVAQIYSSGIYCSLNGYFGQTVTAGQPDTSVQSTLSTYGSLAVKGTLVTNSSYTLAQTETFVYVDPSQANVCTGTPPACSTYGTESPCNARSGVGCSWYAGDACSAFNGTDSSTCLSGHTGCTWEETSCGPAGNNTDSTTCEGQDDTYGGSCFWDTSLCPSLGASQGTCEAQTGCTWNFSDCTTFNGNSQGTCEGNIGCTWTGAACSAFDGTDQSTCETGHTGCTWDGGTNTCNGVYDEASTCSGQYDTSCTGDICTGTFATGNCTGTYNAFCQGTANCNNLTDDGSTACNAESGCAWTVGITVTLPTTANASRGTTGRVYSILHVGETGTVNIVGQSGQPIFQYTNLPLLKKGDKVLLHNQNITFQCSIFVASGTCTAQTGCTWRDCPAFGDQSSCDGAGCAWDGENNVCTGGTSCVGTYSNGAHWYAHSLERGLNYVAKTANYTVTSIDDIIDCTSGTFTLTLPSAPLNNGKQYTLKNTGTGVITLNTTSSQTIDGVASGVMTLTTGDSITIMSNNSNWVVV